MLTLNDYNNLAAKVAEENPNDPKAYVETYQEDLFQTTNKIKIKGGYEVEAVDKFPNGKIKKVKITMDGLTESYNLQGAKLKFSQEIEKKIETKYQIKSNKSYYITVSGVKKGKIIEKKLKYDVITTDLLKDFLDSEFITIKSSYRVISLGNILERLSNMVSVSGVLKEFGRVMEDVESNCGMLGTECLNLKDSFNIFMVINSVMFKNNFYPIGNFILVDDTIIQQYGKNNINSLDANYYSSIQKSVDAPTNNIDVVAEGIKNKNKNKKKHSKRKPKKKTRKKSSKK